MHAFLFSLLAFSFSILSMEYEDKYIKTHAVIIPGLNGSGNGGAYKILPKNIITHEVETPEGFPDFGQGNCQKYLRKALKPLLKDDNIEAIIIFATSQGTATAINYLANNYHEKIKAVILEAVFASGNSAIHHTAIELEKFKVAPYYVLPYLAPYLFYGVGGEQPILNIHKLPKNLPIILVHGINDPQLPYYGAKAIYAGLQITGHKKTYFITVKEGYHFCIDSETAKIVQYILQYHKILDFSNEEILQDLSLYQPEFDYQEYKSLYWSDLTSKIMSYFLKGGFTLSGWIANPTIMAMLFLGWPIFKWTINNNEYLDCLLED